MDVRPDLWVREDWLNEAINKLRPEFDRIGFPLPPVIHVSTGFGMARSLGETPVIRAQTISSWVANDGNLSVFVSPFEENTPTVIMILVHELIHVALDNEDGHRLRFADAAKAIGLQPPLLSLHPSPELEALADALANKLGQYPHAGMDKLRELLSGKRTLDNGEPKPMSDGGTPRRIWSGPKPQTARMIKCQCLSCGYTVRAARTWIEKAAPICPDPECDSFEQEMEVSL